MCATGTQVQIKQIFGFIQEWDSSTEMWQKEKGKKIMMLVRVFWCDMPWDLNWVWGRWRKERAGQAGNGGM